MWRDPDLDPALKTWPLVSLTAAIWATACAPDREAQEWAGSVQDGPGVRVVHNSKQGLGVPGRNGR